MYIYYSFVNCFLCFFFVVVLYSFLLVSFLMVLRFSLVLYLYSFPFLFCVYIIGFWVFYYHVDYIYQSLHIIVHFKLIVTLVPMTSKCTTFLSPTNVLSFWCHILHFFILCKLLIIVIWFTVFVFQHFWSLFKCPVHCLHYIFTFTNEIFLPYVFFYSYSFHHLKVTI